MDGFPSPVREEGLYMGLTTLQIEVDVFSGRTNPIVELKGREAREALDRLRPVERLGEEEKRRLPPVSTLGYRGLVIRQLGKPVKGLPRAFRLVDGSLFGPRSAYRAADGSFESFVLGSSELARRPGLGAEFSRFALEQRDRFLSLIGKWREIPEQVRPTRVICPCAPPYEPDWWNVPRRQPCNNCYNYATNYRTDSSAQPGRAAGASCTSFTCRSVRSAAVRDELVDRPDADNKCPADGHLVGLAVAPGWDFHWYRKGKTGYWSHKPGSSPVTDIDNSRAVIADPRTADRGPYIKFCTFMVAMHGHIWIS
jgi:hypothetical protein